MASWRIFGRPAIILEALLVVLVRSWEDTGARGRHGEGLAPLNFKHRPNNLKLGQWPMGKWANWHLDMGKGTW